HASIFSNKTGINFKGKNNPEDYNIGGALSLHNYSSIISLLLKDDMLGFLKKFSITSRNIYSDASLEFLHSISDHPTSKSDDISFEYSINHNNFNKSKIGSAEIGNLKILFNSVLYQQALKEMTSQHDKSDELLMQLLPTIKPSDIKVLKERLDAYN
ncbi:MAG: hypothetical protein ACRYE9_00895, partial [Janthinobacterium lividum]